MQDADLRILVERIPPVSSAFNINLEDWSTIESEMEIRFPDDYKALTDEYHRVKLGYLTIYDYRIPEDREAATSTMKLFQETQEAIFSLDDSWNKESQGKESSQDCYPVYYPIFPEENELLLWGEGDDGWYYFFQQPSAGKFFGITVCYRLFGNVYEFPEMSLPQYLLQQIDSSIRDFLRLSKRCQVRN